MMKPINADVRAELADYYVWEAFDRPIIVCLDPNAAERLQLAALASRSSGGELSETGGVLLGATRSDGDRLIIFIQDFRPVSRKDWRAPALSKQELAEFKAAAVPSASDKKSLLPVGYYRSHNRDGLYLSPSDLAIIHTHFRQPESVFMLIKTLRIGACTAGFFLWDDGRIHPELPCIEVPLAPVEAPASASNLQRAPAGAARAKRAHGRARGAAPAAAAKPRAPALEVWLVPAQPRPRRARRLKMAAALALIAVAATAAAYGILRIQSRLQPAALLPASDFALNVNQDGGRLTLVWNSRAPEILSADGAVLWIRDGAEQKRILLNAGQLRAGKATYAASAGIVGFGLELHREGKPISAASIQVMRMPDGAQR